MAMLGSQPEGPPEPARAPLGGRLLGCPACGKELADGQKACSGKCRARLSRRRRTAALRARDSEIRELLVTALRKLEEGAP